MKLINDKSQIQQILTNILKFIDEVCQENNLTYSIVGGTAIGAIRHKGFIPWDDDIDIGLLRKDYDKLLQILDSDKYKNSKYKCLYFAKENKNYFYHFAKVVDSTTYLEESNYISCPKMGLYVDIFPFDDIDESKAAKIVKKSQFYASVLSISAQKNINWSKNFFKNLFFKIPSFIFIKTLGYKFWAKKYNKFKLKFKNDNSKLVYPFGGGYGVKDITPKEYFSSTTDVSFENITVKIFKNYDEYLTHVFGDYMTPPPPEKRRWHQITAYLR